MQNNINWIKLKESKYFVFYGLKDTKTERLYYKKCDDHVDRLCRDFKISYKNKKKISYFIISDKDKYKEILGWEPYGRVYQGSIYSVYSFQPHEITHSVLNTHINDKCIWLLSEGIAVVYGWNKNGPLWRQKPLSFWMTEYGDKVSIVALIKNSKNIDSKMGYPIAGCFVHFLINNYGIIKFKKLYKTMKEGVSYKEKDNVFKECMGDSIKKLDKEFHNKNKV